MSSKVVLITGAARGIGRQIVLALASDGWTVLATDLASDIPEVPYPLAMPQELDALGEVDGVHIMRADVRSPEQMYSAVRYASELGTLCSAVACAGIVAGGLPTWQTGVERHRTTFDTNYFGVVNLINAALPEILKAPTTLARSFIAVASAAGHLPLETMSDYVASKHAVVGLIKNLALDLKGTGITANTVSPGSTRTDVLSASAAIYDLADTDAFASHHLTGRLIEPQEIAGLISFLVSGAGTSITGTDLHIDAGMGT